MIHSGTPITPLTSGGYGGNNGVTAVGSSTSSGGGMSPILGNVDSGGAHCHNSGSGGNEDGGNTCPNSGFHGTSSNSNSGGYNGGITPSDPNGGGDGYCGSGCNSP